VAPGENKAGLLTKRETGTAAEVAEPAINVDEDVGVRDAGAPGATGATDAMGEDGEKTNTGEVVMLED
jgi:hypothetical protein